MSPGEVAERFYDALVNRRTDDMESLYDERVRFKDAVFTLDGRDATMRMWRTLIRPGSSATFRYTFERTDGDVAIGHWVADYQLGRRPVHNEIDSRLTVRDGLIIAHEDSFAWPAWARQAFPLGPLVSFPGVRSVLTRVIRKKVLG